MSMVRMWLLAKYLGGGSGGGGGTTHGIPSGGTSGQVLAKSSGTDYDAGWQTLIWVGTQAEYDALGTYDPNTLYCIKE